MKNNKKIIIITIILVITGVIVYRAYKNIDIINSTYEAQKTISTQGEETVENTEEKSQTVADIVESVTKCVVGISKLNNNMNSIFSNNTAEELGMGTGIIVSENGYILSNSHVTGEKYSTCYVTTEEGETYTGTVVWSDATIDLSILKINENNLKSVTLGDSDAVRVGNSVYAIGNPIGIEFRRTVTAGIISAKNRTIRLEEYGKEIYMTDLIQTDATINPGNSGGPLITINGEVIAINTIKITSAEGIGFSIPINVVKPVINSFKENGSFEEASIGIYAYDKDVIKYVSGVKSFSSGIYVAQVIENGPASKTELQEKDIIESIDEKNINTMNQLREYIYTKKPGDIVKIKILRGKINKEIEITLGKK